MKERFCPFGGSRAGPSRGGLRLDLIRTDDVMIRPLQDPRDLPPPTTRALLARKGRQRKGIEYVT